MICSAKRIREAINTTAEFKIVRISIKLNKIGENKTIVLNASLGLN